MDNFKPTFGELMYLELMGIKNNDNGVLTNENGDECTYRNKDVGDEETSYSFSCGDDKIIFYRDKWKARDRITLIRDGVSYSYGENRWYDGYPTKWVEYDGKIKYTISAEPSPEDLDFFKVTFKKNDKPVSYMYCTVSSVFYQNVFGSDNGDYDLRQFEKVYFNGIHNDIVDIDGERQARQFASKMFPIIHETWTKAQDIPVKQVKEFKRKLLQGAFDADEEFAREVERAMEIQRKALEKKEKSMDEIRKLEDDLAEYVEAYNNREAYEEHFGPKL